MSQEVVKLLSVFGSAQPLKELRKLYFLVFKALQGLGPIFVEGQIAARWWGMRLVSADRAKSGKPRPAGPPIRVAGWHRRLMSARLAATKCKGPPVAAQDVGRGRETDRPGTHQCNHRDLRHAKLLTVLS